MNKKLLWYMSSGGGGVDADYQAILTYATSQGYSLPSAGQQAKQNILVKALKSAGAWTKLDIFYCFLTDGDSNFAKLNWKSPSTFFATGSGHEPSFISNDGFRGNGTSTYLDTQWTPSTNGVQYTLTDAGIILYSKGVQTVAFGYTVGAANGGPTLGFGPVVAGNGLIGMNSATTTTNTFSGAQTGFFHMNTVSAANLVTIYKNGALLNSPAPVKSSLPISKVFIDAKSQPGAANFNDELVSCFGAGASMTGLESSVYTAWNTYYLSH